MEFWDRVAKDLQKFTIDGYTREHIIVALLTHLFISSFLLFFDFVV